VQENVSGKWEQLPRMVTFTLARETLGRANDVQHFISGYDIFNRYNDGE